MQAINALITFGLYPVEIFPGVVRVLLYTLIPAAFVGSLPVSLLSDFNRGRLAVLLASTAGFVLAARGGLRLGTAAVRIGESGDSAGVRGWFCCAFP